MNDLESWIYNLTEANKSPTEKPTWYKQFSLKEAYNITDLSPRSLKNLSYKLAKNKNKLTKVNHWKSEQNSQNN